MNTQERLKQGYILILKDLASRSIIKKFNRETRKVYKLLLCGIFGEIIHNGAFYNTDCFKLAYNMNEKYKEYNRVITIEMYEEL
ncbi:hypothetical protein V7Y53_19365, partial [Bacillus velezensis]